LGHAVIVSDDGDIAGLAFPFVDLWLGAALQAVEEGEKEDKFFE
jgi:hypothetical protein